METFCAVRKAWVNQKSIPHPLRRLVQGRSRKGCKLGWECLSGYVVIAGLVVRENI